MSELPIRWVRNKGSIYYRVPAAVREQWDNKQWFKLGDNEVEAWRTWNSRLHGSIDNTLNFSRLLDGWCDEHVFNSKRVRPATQRQYVAALKKLRPVFGHMDVNEIKRSDIKKYYMARFDNSQQGAQKELQTISAFLSWCLDQDMIEHNPAFKMNVPRPQPRKHYVEDYDISALLSFAGDLVSRYIPLKVYTGARKNDILSIRTFDWREDGLHVGDRKSMRAITGEQKLGRIYARNKELEMIMDLVLSDCGQKYLFETKEGNPYINFEKDTTDGFDSVWQRTKQRAIASGEMYQCFDPNKKGYMELEEARAKKLPLVFQERDLRAKVASDSANITEAQQRLGHTSSLITQRVYNRKKIVIQ